MARKKVSVSISVDIDVWEFASEIAELQYQGNMSQALNLLLRRGKVYTKILQDQAKQEAQ